MIKKTERLFKALGDLNRLRIINLLNHKTMCVCEMTTVLHISQSTVSGHLRVLRDADLVEDTKEGLWVVYSLNKTNPFIADIVNLTTSKLQNDPTVTNDRAMSDEANRELLCKK